MSHAEQVEELAELLVDSTDREQNRDDSDPVIQLWIMLFIQQAKEQSK